MKAATLEVAISRKFSIAKFWGETLLDCHSVTTVSVVICAPAVTKVIAGM